jgi:hypothetical protein
MEEGNQFKPGARCRLYTYCPIYNAGILREEVEEALCGRGQEVQRDYIPRIQQIYTPLSKNVSSPPDDAVCPAFAEEVQEMFVGKVREYLERTDSFWRGETGFDDIL